MIDLGTIPLVVAIHLAGMVVVAAVFRIPLYGIHYGVGPTLLRKTLARTDVTLRLLPIAAHVQIEPPEETATHRGGPWRRPVHSHPSRLGKVALHASGCAALLLFGMVVLGPREALASLGRGFVQILGGALDPLGKGADNVRALGRLLAHAPFLPCAAVVSIKAAAFNLLPVPPLNGFQIIHSAVLPEEGGTGLTWALNLGVLALLLLLGSYGVALAVVLWFS